MRKPRRRASMSIMIVILAVSASLIIASSLALTTGAAAVQRGAMNREQATFLADAGFEHAMMRLKSDPTWRAGFTNQSLGGGTYTVTLVDDTGDVIVTSTGVVGTISVQVINRVGWGS
ncbi:MAG: hypothetical protein HOP29_03660 [Phycisphaerales bacterium]|nr:hypothetical protein [Phycisphaerales bacterium]